MERKPIELSRDELKTALKNGSQKLDELKKLGLAGEDEIQQQMIENAEYVAELVIRQ